MATLESGGSFGEKALLEETTRAATVQCLTDCDFAVLKKADYIRVLKKIELKLFNEKLEFFKN